MNEKSILKSSVYVFLIGCLVMSITGIVLKDISYILGFILGYLINICVFFVIIKMTDAILLLNSSTILIIVGFFLKLGLYALGFFIAVKSSYVHIIGVFLGYLVTKITINLEGYRQRGGDNDG